MLKKSNQTLSRRQFLRLGSLAAGGIVLAACSPTAQPSNETDATAVAPRPTEPAADEGVQVMVKDVIEYQLGTDDWTGMYGSVTFKLHEGRFNGAPIYYIRTDASETGFAEKEGLVYVPLLNQGRDIAQPVYVFEDGRPAVFGSSPSQEDYVSLFKINQVTVKEDSATLDTADAVAAAIEAGEAEVAENTIFVNYPIVKWDGGELAVDEEKTETLGTGQLISAVDTENMTVELKLHQCFPGSRYILTDTSSIGMAPMMSVPASTPTQALMDSGATDEIWIFVNGIPGSGVAGFQPAVFDNKAGEPAWSPFWNHHALKWTDESKAKVIRTSAEIRELVASGDLEQFNGVPDSHPNGFVVNCPAPILAPNDFEA